PSLLVVKTPPAGPAPGVDGVRRTPVGKSSPGGQRSNPVLLATSRGANAVDRRAQWPSASTRLAIRASVQRIERTRTCRVRALDSRYAAFRKISVGSTLPQASDR